MSVDVPELNYNDRDIAPLPPDDIVEPNVSSRKHVAAGPSAVLTSARRSIGEMGVIRSLRVLNDLNQTDGYDCPGCAWPDPTPGERSSIAEYCENGAKAVAEEATKKRVTPEFFAQWSVEQLTRKSEYWLGQQGRITQPMILRAGSSHYAPIAWDDAFQFIADELNALDSPDEAVFYTSGRTSNEAAFLYQLFVRMFGTNNLPDCSNMCHESSGTGLNEVIGVGKGTVMLSDIHEAEVIFVVGQNPGTCHPRMLSALQEAKRNGAKILHVNPLPETGLERFKNPQEVVGWLGTGTKLADLFLQVRIGGDIALFKGIMKALLELEAARPSTVLDLAFIEQKTQDFEAFADDLWATDWAEVVAASGVEQASIREAAALVAAHERIVICWAMGLTQHEHGVGNVQSMVNLLLLRGAFGKRGAGACPVRGHSNVQGDRTVGIWDKPPDDLLERLAAAFDFKTPRKHGFDAVESIRAMHDGRAKIFFAMGGNFISATPDTAFTAEATRRCRLTVYVSTKLNRAHAVTGAQALILPCLGRTERDVQASGEQFVSVENSMSIVHDSQGLLDPASEHLKSEPAIVAGLAKATLGTSSTVDWDALIANYDRIRDGIETVIPGFGDYNRRVREPGGFQLPNAVRDEQRFATDTGRAKFTIHPIPNFGVQDGQLLMTTMRSHDQFNTTIYGLDDRYRGVRGERRVVFLHPDDLAERNLASGDVVDLVSHFAGEKRVAPRFVALSYAIPRGCAGTYFPEANVLVPVDHTARKSNQPASKSVIISVQRSDAG